VDFVVFFLSLVFFKAESHECCNTWFVHRTGYTFVFLVEVNNTHTCIYTRVCVRVRVLRGTGSWTTSVSHEEHNSCAQGYILYILYVYIYIFFFVTLKTRANLPDGDLPSIWSLPRPRDNYTHSIYLEYTYRVHAKVIINIL